MSEASETQEWPMKVDGQNCFYRLLMRWWWISRVGTWEKKDKLFIFSSAGACSQLIGFFGKVFYSKEGNLCPSLVSLQKPRGWSGSLILAGSRGLDLWWHINWAVPLKKRKASVSTSPMLFAELWNWFCLAWKLWGVYLHIRMFQMAAGFLSLAVCLQVCLKVYSVFAHLCTCSCVRHVCAKEIKTEIEKNK